MWIWILHAPHSGCWGRASRTCRSCHLRLRDVGRHDIRSVLPVIDRLTGRGASSNGLDQNAAGAARGKDDTVQAQQVIPPGLLSPLRT